MDAGGEDLRSQQEHQPWAREGGRFPLTCVETSGSGSRSLEDLMSLLKLYVASSLLSFVYLDSSV